MITFKHIDGDSAVTVTQLENKTFEIVLSESGQSIVTTRKDTLEDATKAYLKFVTYEIASYADGYEKQLAIESLVAAL